MKNGWRELKRRDAESLLARLRPLLSPTALSVETTSVLSKVVPFYPGHEVFKLKLHAAVPPIEITAVAGETHLSVLTGTNGPIYKLNFDVPILLNVSNVVEYVRFFFAFTHGRHGYFHIVETADDLSFEPGVDVQRQSDVTSLLKPMRLVRAIGGNDPAFRLECTFFFNNALFDCPVIVDDNGFVDMKEERLLVEDIPAVPIERYR